ncbi:FAD-binding domain-containing protein [Pseudomonas sp. NW5]|uniref:FAD-binding domain-containing protein n=1 Tax=Pseudomonas sp. NW5 TaxID=2934934 RepID=UPI002022370D|nr:FAD-binding domain-containing protein [Pseudomonas sp. NW5]
MRLLASFLGERGRRYHGSRGAPDAASQHGTRLSAHLAYGCLSLREVVQATRRVRQQASDPRWIRSLEAFLSRLYWHCHFMQKLEDQPDIEWRNLQRSLDGLREDPPNPQRLAAWREGRTGYPLVDACMRSLTACGWLNFRMRALLMSFASYLLNLHWQQPGQHLARLFTDYEPGIHWSQVQMQSGTTGINAWRIYNPLRQSLSHDPHGHFIRRWVPELRRVPDAWIHEPWKMPKAVQTQHGCRIGTDYPAPLIDHQQAARQARQALREHLAKHRLEAGEERQQIRQRHASRSRKPRLRRPPNTQQLHFEF